MILKMMDRTEMFVDNREGQAIRQALTKSSEGFITVRGTTIKKSAIMKLEEGGADPKQTNVFEKPDPVALLEASGCRGEHTITRELMRIASKTKAFKKLGDPKWRAAETAKLKKAGVKLCDPNTGDCACSVT